MTRWTLPLLLAGAIAPAQDITPTPNFGDSVPTYQPLTISQRYEWAARSSITPARTAGYLVSSAISTATNEPKEYGPHWDGLAKRFGLRAANGAVGTLMEASIGALWDEDPRYDRATGQPVLKRLAHVGTMTFLARNRDGELTPAYARYISAPANSFLSNEWRPDSQANVNHALVRIPTVFLNRAIGNLFNEFWPDAKRLLHGEGRTSAAQ
jgi:hypothetical protein